MMNEQELIVFQSIASSLERIAKQMEPPWADTQRTINDMITDTSIALERIADAAEKASES